MERRRFTGEFKAEAVRQALLPGVSKAQVAQDLGIHSNMLRKWIRLAQGDSHPKLVKATESAVELARENQRSAPVITTKIKAQSKRFLILGKTIRWLLYEVSAFNRHASTRKFVQESLANFSKSAE